MILLPGGTAGWRRLGVSVSFASLLALGAVTAPQRADASLNLTGDLRSDSQSLVQCISEVRPRDFCDAGWDASTMPALGQTTLQFTDLLTVDAKSATAADDISGALEVPQDEKPMGTRVAEPRSLTLLGGVFVTLAAFTRGRRLCRLGRPTPAGSAPSLHNFISARSMPLAAGGFSNSSAALPMPLPASQMPLWEEARRAASSNTGDPSR